MGIPTFSRFMASFANKITAAAASASLSPSYRKRTELFFLALVDRRNQLQLGKNMEKNMQVSLGLTWFSMAQLGSTRCSTSFNKNKQGSMC